MSSYNFVDLLDHNGVDEIGLDSDDKEPINFRTAEPYDEQSPFADFEAKDIGVDYTIAENLTDSIDTVETVAGHIEEQLGQGVAIETLQTLTNLLVRITGRDEGKIYSLENYKVKLTPLQALEAQVSVEGVGKFIKGAMTSFWRFLIETLSKIGRWIAKVWNSFTNLFRKGDAINDDLDKAAVMNDLADKAEKGNLADVEEEWKKSEYDKYKSKSSKAADDINKKHDDFVNKMSKPHQGNPPENKDEVDRAFESIIDEINELLKDDEGNSHNSVEYIEKQLNDLLQTEFSSRLPTVGYTGDLGRPRDVVKFINNHLNNAAIALKGGMLFELIAFIRNQIHFVDSGYKILNTSKNLTGKELDEVFKVMDASSKSLSTFLKVPEDRLQGNEIFKTNIFSIPKFLPNGKALFVDLEIDADKGYMKYSYFKSNYVKDRDDGRFVDFRFKFFSSDDPTPIDTRPVVLLIEDITKTISDLQAQLDKILGRVANNKDVERNLEALKNKGKDTGNHLYNLENLFTFLELNPRIIKEIKKKGDKDTTISNNKFFKELTSDENVDSIGRGKLTPDIKAQLTGMRSGAFFNWYDELGLDNSQKLSLVVDNEKAKRSPYGYYMRNINAVTMLVGSVGPYVVNPIGSQYSIIFNEIKQYTNSYALVCARRAELLIQLRAAKGRKGN